MKRLITLLLCAPLVCGAANIILHGSGNTLNWWSEDALNFCASIATDGAAAPTNCPPVTVLTNLPSIESGRYMDFSPMWTKDFDTNYYFNVDIGQWYGSGLSQYTQIGYVPAGGTAPVLAIRGIPGAFIQSPPLAGGVGTIYFTSRMREPSQSGEIHIQVATTETPDPDEWETVLEILFPFSLVRTERATPVVLNRSDVKVIRFLRIDGGDYDTTSNRTDSTICFDNIVITFPYTQHGNVSLWGWSP